MKPIIAVVLMGVVGTYAALNYGGEVVAVNPKAGGEYGFKPCEVDCRHVDIWSEDGFYVYDVPVSATNILYKGHGIITYTP